MARGSRSRRAVALAVVLAFCGVVSLGRPAAAQIDTPDVVDDGVGPAEVTLLRTTAPAMRPGEAAWIHLTWTAADAAARQFRVTATHPDGSEVGYPENTVDHSSLYWDDELAISEIDYTALRVTLPADLEVPLVLDVRVTYVSDGEEVSEEHAVVVPIEGGGDPDPAPPEEGGVVYDSNEDGMDGWEFDPYGTDTATSGRWAFADSPDQIVWAGYTTQLGSTPQGTSGLFTGATRGADTGADDVDGGVTSVLSPTFALPSGHAQVEFAWYFAYLRNASADDFFSVSVVDDDTTTPVLAVNGQATWQQAAWTTDRFDLSAWSGRPVRFLVEVADLGEPSLIEAAVADVRIVALDDVAAR